MMIQQIRLTELGKTIRKVRLQVGLTQQQLGERSGFDATYISMLERGRRNPPFLTLCLIAKHLETPLHTMLRDFEKKLPTVMSEEDLRRQRR